MATLEEVIDAIVGRKTQDSSRLTPLADYARSRFESCGLPGVMGGTEGELRIVGLARSKDWDVAYDFAGKRPLLVSLKSIWKNAGGTVPNRIDDLMGEAANVQQMSPEIVTGSILLFDIQADSLRREDGRSWSQFFEAGVKRIAIRRAPLWNQGLLEGCWFVRFNSAAPSGARLVEPEKTEAEGNAFFRALLPERAETSRTSHSVQQADRRVVPHDFPRERCLTPWRSSARRSVLECDRRLARTGLQRATGA